jgi:hypothetical protein
MAALNAPQDNETETDLYPLEPRYHPVNKVSRSIYDFLASAKLAMFLLVTILLCCLVGATVFREQQATDMVFGTFWFNGLLVLLVLNTACCFFGRMWKRKITVITFGMILFHLSFVAMFVAIVANSLFYFDGVLRLTEGETLSNRDPKSYDFVRHGLLFSYSRLKGETTLQRVHRGFKVDGDDKQIAFDITMADGAEAQNATIYINNKFTYRGVEYIRDREGYSLLVILNDRQGKELYGVHISLQSLKQQDGSYIYSTGTALRPGLIDFPPEREKAYFGLQMDYVADSKNDRAGKVRFQVWPVTKKGDGHPTTPLAGGSPHEIGSPHSTDNPISGTKQTAATKSPTGPVVAEPGNKPEEKRIADGSANVGEKFAFGEYLLSVPEVRYWVAMNVSYKPGKPFVLASLCIGLIGIIITTIGRMVRSRR